VQQAWCDTHSSVNRTLVISHNSLVYLAVQNSLTLSTSDSGVVSGTTVRALVLGRFSQKKLKIELKDNAIK